MKHLKYYLISFLVIAVDQLSKLLVHANMELGEEIPIFGNWFRLHYLLNPGMAFGIEFDSEYGKLFLTVFRMIASVAIGYMIYNLSTKKADKKLLIFIALILGGAVGNVLDSIFYGVFLENNAIPGAFTPWFHGQVIDMLYFPLFSGFLPDWLPIWGGKYFIFFSPVFNIADSCIFIGVASILLFQHNLQVPGVHEPTNHADAQAQDVPAKQASAKEKNQEENKEKNKGESNENADASQQATGQTRIG